jgi:hypothetical protein
LAAGAGPTEEKGAMGYARRSWRRGELRHGSHLGVGARACAQLRQGVLARRGVDHRPPDHAIEASGNASGQRHAQRGLAHPAHAHDRHQFAALAHDPALQPLERGLPPAKPLHDRRRAPIQMAESRVAALRWPLCEAGGHVQR